MLFKNSNRSWVFFILKVFYLLVYSYLSHQFLYVDETARLPCWLPRSQQVLHQTWIWGIHCIQATTGADPGFLVGGGAYKFARFSQKLPDIKKKLCVCVGGGGDPLGFTTGQRMRIKESTLALKSRADINRSSKLRYQWPHKNHRCPPFFFLNLV